jgi:nucleoside-diphosphate-sugar epimerase
MRLLVRDNAEADTIKAVLATTEVRPQVVIGDIADRRTVDELFDGVGADCDVVHTAGVIHPLKIQQLFDVNVTGTEHVAAAATNAGVRRFVHVSSNSPFGTNPHANDVFRADEPYHPYLAYGRSKMQGELAVFAAVERGLDASIVRPPWFYGPFQPPRQTTFFRMVRNGKFPVIAGGQQRRSMVYVDNLVDGLLLAELTPRARGKAYWIADARPYVVTEIVDTVGRALRDEGFTVKDGAMRLPAVAARIAEVADGLIQRTGRYQQQLHVLGEMGHTIACDISLARSDLGYDPAVDLYEGMRRSIRWCVEQGLEL